MDRRKFLFDCSKIIVGLPFLNLIGCVTRTVPIKISLAEWSLHRAIYSKEIDHLDFIRISKKKFNIDAVEYVNSFFFEKAEDTAYLNEMKTIADDHGVKSLLIMCDNEGDLGDSNIDKRKKAIENHYKWVEAAKYLGCHSIRVNARGDSSYDNLMNLVSDSLSKLAEFSSKLGINVLVENHGGLSSNGLWLAGLMEKVNKSNCGTLPDFGNFHLGDDQWYDRYKGMKELMPFAKAVSAKSHDFDENGDEIHTDYYKMINIVNSFGYDGYIGIEYEGSSLDEYSGIKATKNLLEKVKTFT